MIVFLISCLIVLIAIVVYVPFCFTIVKEGTAKAVVRLGAFKKGLLVWSRYILDKDWNVIKGKKWNLPGGLRFKGFPPFDKIYNYDFRWRDIQLVEGTEKVEFHREKINYIFVRPDVYWTDIKKAETKPPERIPVNVQFLVTIRVINIFEALFMAPSNWNENVMSKLNALFRTWVATKTFDNLLGFQENVSQLWQEFKNDPLIVMFKNDWGIQAEAIEIRDIGVTDEYEEAAAAEKKMSFKAKGMMAETMGALMEMLSKATRKPVEELQDKFRNDSGNTFTKYKSLIDFNADFIRRLIALNRGVRREVGVDGATGLEKMVLDAILTYQGGVPRGGAGSKPDGAETKPSDESWRKKKRSEMTEAQRKQLYDEEFGEESSAVA